MIKVENVHYAYPNGFEAIRGVSLEIDKGEFVAIMGENGAGKTTLVKLFNGLLKPSKGIVTVDGIRTFDVSVATLARKVGFVFQNPDHQLFCETVKEEVAFALKNMGFQKDVIEKRVDWALNLLDIAKYKGASPFTLSGGERKRVALASVLAFDPDYLILDEPTIGQDYSQKERLRHLILQLNQQGKTVIIVTHDVEFVAECKPRIILMSKGKIVAQGPAREVLPKADLLSQASLIMPQITQLFQMLSDLGLPSNILDEYEAWEVLKDLRGIRLA
ncbi:MAG: ABC transporter ATP-binding protein [Candidatus Bathyarchaeia archaeon]